MIPDWINEPLPMSLIGALAGALRAWARTHGEQGHAKASADALIGIVFAIALADWLTPLGYPKTALLIGAFAAMTGARALDAVFELVPELVREAATGWLRKRFGASYDDWRRDKWYPPRLPPGRQTGKFTRPDQDEENHDER